MSEIGRVQSWPVSADLRNDVSVDFRVSSQRPAIHGDGLGANHSSRAYVNLSTPQADVPALQHSPVPTYIAQLKNVGQTGMQWTRGLVRHVTNEGNEALGLLGHRPVMAEQTSGVFENLTTLGFAVGLATTVVGPGKFKVIVNKKTAVRVEQLMGAPLKEMRLKLIRLIGAAKQSAQGVEVAQTKYARAHLDYLTALRETGRGSSAKNLARSAIHLKHSEEQYVLQAHELKRKQKQVSLVQEVGKVNEASRRVVQNVWKR